MRLPLVVALGSALALGASVPSIAAGLASPQPVMISFSLTL